MPVPILSHPLTRFKMFRIEQSLVACLAVCLAAVVASTAAGAESLDSANSARAISNASPAKQSSPKPAAKHAPVLITPEREAAALEFVRDHHPELVDLLKGLKNSHPAQYQAALRQLFQTSERLAKIHEIDPQRYELELKLWKIKSRIQLLAARSSLGRDPEIEAQLKSALAEQAQVQLQELQMDRDRAAERLNKIDASIEQFQANRERNIARQFETLMREVDRHRLQSTKPTTAAKPPAHRAAQPRPCRSYHCDSYHCDPYHCR